MMVSRMREAGEAIVRVCSACVSQLMKSCSELWKSVAMARASSNFTCNEAKRERERERQKERKRERERQPSSSHKAGCHTLMLTYPPARLLTCGSGRERSICSFQDNSSVDGKGDAQLGHILCSCHNWITML